MHCRSLPRLLSRRALSTRGPTIAVHGGAWAIPDDLRQASLDGVGRATALGWEALTSTGSAVDAVEAAVRYLEEDPAFDAGRGAVLTSAGTVELDAVIMDGRDLSAGAVASLGPVLNPVSVARAVMERSEHVLLCGAGADAFAREIGVEASSADDLVTAAAREEYEAMKAYPTTVETLFNARAQLGHDTVGAVAVDRDGNVAAATSTGGITFKRPGRVGDSPILGSGCLADNATGCISTTGHGESLMRFTFASRWAAAVDGGAAPAKAAAAGDAPAAREPKQPAVLGFAALGAAPRLRPDGEDGAARKRAKAAAADDDAALGDRLAALEALATREEAQTAADLAADAGHAAAADDGSGASLAAVLDQAVRCGDDALLETVLRRTEPATVAATCAKLAPSLALPTLDALAARLERSPLRAADLAGWVKALLLQHASHLATLPKLADTLARLQYVVDARVAALPKFLSLLGKFDLLLHKKTGAAVSGAASAEVTPLNVVAADATDDEDEEEEDDDMEEEDDDDDDESEEEEDDDDDESSDDDDE